MSIMDLKLKEYKSYHNNGALSDHYFRKDGELHGEYKSYHKNGELEEHCCWKDGEFHGEYKWFRENGELFEHCFYKDGEYHGEYKWDGEHNLHCFYNNGDKEELTLYVEDPNNITDDEFMNLTMVFGINFFVTTPSTETPL